MAFVAFHTVGLLFFSWRFILEQGWRSNAQDAFKSRVVGLPLRLIDWPFRTGIPNAFDFLICSVKLVSCESCDFPEIEMTKLTLYSFICQGVCHQAGTAASMTGDMSIHCNG